MFNTATLLSSLFWGSIGAGYFVYGKRQRSFVPMIGGVLLIAASYFAGSVLEMSLISGLIIAAIHLLLKRGY
jgi:hypothetical protein